MQLIQSLPDQDAAALFGLPLNIEHAQQKRTAYAVIAQLKTLVK